MNEITSTFLQSELNYRTDRIKSGVTSKGRRKDGRVPRMRRSNAITR